MSGWRRSLPSLIMVLTSTLGWPQISSTGNDSDEFSSVKELRADDVLNEIKNQLTCSWADETVDSYKSGDGSTTVKGIATTFLATQAVLEQAADLGLNMVITHEPTFYNHRDETTFFEGDPVYEVKRSFLEKHNMVLLRFHDHWHRTRPDGIHLGMVRRLGWKEYQVDPGEMVFKMPPQRLHDLTAALQKDFDANNMRVVGDPDARVSMVGMAVGAPGSKAQIRMLRRDDVQVLITGETPEWETVEYVRDAQAQGKRKYLILMGHAHSEEAGMEYCAEWLQTFIKDVPVQFIPAGNPLWTPN